MKEFEGIVSFGRMMKTSSARMGALIQLEGNLAYLVNSHRSLALKIECPNLVGTGTFYSGEAPTTAQKIERRDDQVLFEWKEGSDTRQVFVPNKDSINEQTETLIKEYFSDEEGLAEIPFKSLEGLNPSILVTRLKIQNNELLTDQRRSDGAVRLSNSYGLSRLREYDNTDEIPIFTADLMPFRTFSERSYIRIVSKDKPMSIKALLNFGVTVRGVVSNLVYEV